MQKFTFLKKKGASIARKRTDKKTYDQIFYLLQKIYRRSG